MARLLSTLLLQILVRVAIQSFCRMLLKQLAFQSQLSLTVSALQKMHLIQVLLLALVKRLLPERLFVAWRFCCVMRFWILKPARKYRLSPLRHTVTERLLCTLMVVLTRVLDTQTVKHWLLVRVFIQKIQLLVLKNLRAMSSVMFTLSQLISLAPTNLIQRATFVMPLPQHAWF